jgi:hypothetical protein
MPLHIYKIVHSLFYYLSNLPNCSVAVATLSFLKDRESQGQTLSLSSLPLSLLLHKRGPRKNWWEVSDPRPWLTMWGLEGVLGSEEGSSTLFPCVCFLYYASKYVPKTQSQLLGVWYKKAEIQRRAPCLTVGTERNVKAISPGWRKNVEKGWFLSWVLIDQVLFTRQTQVQKRGLRQRRQHEREKERESEHRSTMGQAPSRDL